MNTRQAIDPVRGIDHVMVIVNEVARAGQTYEKLGFMVQPIGRHANQGTANHLMIFGDTYLELMGVDTPLPSNQTYADFAAAGGGIKALALKTDSAEEAVKHWKSTGFSVDPVALFRRQVVIEGRAEQASFGIAHLDPADAPGVGIFVCQHDTPQFVYRKDWTIHRNTVSDVVSLTIVADDPASYRTSALGAFGPNSKSEISDGMLSIRSGNSTIRYVTPDRFAADYGSPPPRRTVPSATALSFRVNDIQAAHNCLNEAGIQPSIMPDGRLIVGAEHAENVVVEFIPANT